MLNLTATPMEENTMAKHYSHKKMKGKGSKRMMLPRDAAGGGYGADTQMYHKKGYYGPGEGHIANMPPYADMHYYPQEKSYLMTDKYPDTLREIDSDAGSNMKTLKRQPSKSMY